MTRTYGLKIGDGFIRDLLNPKPEELDLDAIKGRLMATRRFTNNPKALTVYQHMILVDLLARNLLLHPGELDDDVLFWCRHHDTHEGIIGDIPGPLKSLLSTYTAILDVIENGIDQALCQKLGRTSPSGEVRALVHTYDKMAETIEWLYVLEEPLEPWNHPVDDRVTPGLARRLILMAKSV